MLNLRSLTNDDGVRWMLVAVMIVTVAVLYATMTRTVDDVANAARHSDIFLPQNAWVLAETTIALNERMVDGVATSTLYAEIRRREYDGLIIVRPVNWYVYYEVGGPFYYVTSTNKFGDSNYEQPICGPSETPCMIFEAVDSNDERMKLGNGRKISNNATVSPLYILSAFTEKISKRSNEIDGSDSGGDGNYFGETSGKNGHSVASRYRSTCLTVPFPSLLRLFSDTRPSTGKPYESVANTTINVPLDDALRRSSKDVSTHISLVSTIVADRNDINDDDEKDDSGRRITLIDLLNELIERRVL